MYRFINLHMYTGVRKYMKISRDNCILLSFKMRQQVLGPVKKWIRKKP